MKVSQPMRTPMRRVLGLGAARSGTSHFWYQRVTSVAGIPLTIGLLLASQGPDHAEFPAGNSRVRSFVAPLIHRHEPQEHFKIAAA